MATNTLIVQLSGLGTDIGPLFNIYGNADNYVLPLVQNVHITALTGTPDLSTSGFRFNVDSKNTIIRVRSVGTCVNYVDHYTTCLSSTPTPTPTQSPTPPEGVTPTPTPTPVYSDVKFQVLSACGDNSYGKLGIGRLDIYQQYTFKDVINTYQWKSIKAGASHSFILAANNVYAAGNNINGQLGLGSSAGTKISNFTKVFDKENSNIKDIGVTSTGTVLLIGEKIFAVGRNMYGELGMLLDLNTQTNRFLSKNDNSRWSKIAAGYSHVVALSADRKLFVTGNNEYGQLGTGTTTNQNGFTPLTGEWDDVVCGKYSTYARKISTDEWYATGSNLFGQLGLSNYNNTNVFTKIPGNYRKIITNSVSDFAFALSGTKLYGAGINVFNQLGLSTLISSVDTFSEAKDITIIPNEKLYIACGSNHTLLLSGSNLFVIGYNGQGQLGLPQTVQRSTTRFTQISGTFLSAGAGGNFSFVLGEYIDAPQPTPTPTPTPLPPKIPFEDPLELGTQIYLEYAGTSSINGQYTLSSVNPYYFQHNDLSNVQMKLLSGTEEYSGWLWSLTRGTDLLYSKPGKILIDPEAIWNVYYPLAESPAPRIGMVVDN